MDWQKIATKPGEFFFQTNTRRLLYKTVSRMFCSKRLFLRRKLARQLPSVPSQGLISKKDGWRIFDAAEDFVFEKSAAISAADSIISSIGNRRGMAPPGREFLQNFIGSQQLRQYPEILQLGLSEPLLAMVTEYLGELPVLPYIFLWRSEASLDPLKTSQFYHLDHSDMRQIKLFVFLSDINEQNGPLTVIPAPSSRKLQRKLHYNWLPNRRRVRDEDIYLYPESSSKKSLVGKKGTTALIDTSRLFHYGSRVKNGTRYILVYRYLTINSFLFNPFVKKPYPLADLVCSHHSPVQRAVLTGLP